MASFITCYTIPLRQGLSLNAIWLMSSLCPAIPEPQTRGTGMQSQAQLFMSTGGSNSDPHACTASALTHQPCLLSVAVTTHHDQMHHGRKELYGLYVTVHH